MFQNHNFVLASNETVGGETEVLSPKSFTKPNARTDMLNHNKDALPCILLKGCNCLWVLINMLPKMGPKSSAIYHQ